MKMTKEEFAQYLCKICKGFLKGDLRETIRSVDGVDREQLDLLDAEEGDQYIQSITFKLLVKQSPEVNQLVLRKLSEKYSDKLLQHLAGRTANNFDELVMNSEYPTSRAELLSELVSLFPTVTEFDKLLRFHHQPIRNKLSEGNPESVYMEFIMELEKCEYNERYLVMGILSKGKNSPIFKQWMEYYYRFIPSESDKQAGITHTPADIILTPVLNLQIKHAIAVLEELGEEKIKKKNFNGCIVAPQRQKVCKIQTPSFGLVEETCNDALCCSNAVNVFAIYTTLNNCVNKFPDKYPTSFRKTIYLDMIFEELISVFFILLRKGLEYSDSDGLEYQCRESAGIFNKILQKDPTQMFQKYIFEEFDHPSKFNNHLQMCVAVFLNKVGYYMPNKKIEAIFTNLMKCTIFYHSRLFLINRDYNCLSQVINSLKRSVNDTCNDIAKLLKENKRAIYQELKEKLKYPEAI